MEEENKVTQNEFDNLDVGEEDTPTQDFSDVPQQQGQQNDMISTGDSGTTYDWTQAPDGVKAPPRQDLNGQIIKIKKADIILPAMSTPWDMNRAKTKDLKYCKFVLYYDKEGQQEFYSGVRVFKRDDGKYSPPTITKDRNNQASKLLGLYCDFKGKDINEVSLREFMGFLNSTPNAEILGTEVKNPTNEDIIKKNLVGKFVE